MGETEITTTYSIKNKSLANNLQLHCILFVIICKILAISRVVLTLRISKLAGLTIGWAHGWLGSRLAGSVLFDCKKYFSTESNTRVPNITK